ncbi:hypothetical protein D1BOALGB6SA_9941 [Olavius sp. associated proteobacterium Delta 1]|nr:hypothetical protein D1BOALGB6SA_9941 [Olavius sp. associated proteobacterium Delta 1]
MALRTALSCGLPFSSGKHKKIQFRPASQFPALCFKIIEAKSVHNI